MTVSFELGIDFLVQEDIPLSAHDLKFGFERGWLHAPTLIEQASRELGEAEDNDVLRQVASLEPRDIDQLPAVLAQLDSPDRVHDPRSSARKWLYLQLKAVYHRREDLADPLGVVEVAYADFDYPQAIEGFVRYMPLRPGYDPGEAALLRRWGAYLRNEHAALRRGSISR